jgi:uncharacterized protein (DUF2267 family)
MNLRIEDLPADELRMALSVDPNDLPPHEARALRDFIARIGGEANAALAVELLEAIEQA